MLVILFLILSAVGKYKMTKKLGFKWYYMFTYLYLINISRSYGFYKQAKLFLIMCLSGVLLPLVLVVLTLLEVYMVIPIILILMFATAISVFVFQIIIFIKQYSAFEYQSKKLNKFTYFLSCLFNIDSLYLSSKDFRKTDVQITDVELRDDKLLVANFFVVYIITQIVSMVLRSFL